MKKNTIEDIFGDIGNLVPPKINYNTKKNNVRGKGAKIIKAPELGKLLGIYEYDKGLIRSIEMRSWGAEFNFYDGFIEYAVNYFDAEKENSDYISFFSFTPQYSQMTLRQMNYYLFWRSNFRKGECIKADFSYIMLFIYEVINMPENLLPPTKGVRYLGYLWMKYRTQYPQLDKYLSEWMIDYCIIHSVECPIKYLKGFFHDILKNTTLPEFYLNNLEIHNAEAILMTTCSDYDFTKSKQVTDENREIFSHHINGALKSCFALDKQTGAPTLVNIVRDSYIGALCLYENKRRMTISHYKLERTEIDSAIATEAVKYAEGLVRSGLGLRAKQVKTNLTPAIKNRIDTYFMGEITSFKKPTGAIKEIGEKRYEPESHGFSPEEAEKIELESRGVAELLEGNSSNENEFGSSPLYGSTDDTIHNTNTMTPIRESEKAPKNAEETPSEESEENSTATSMDQSMKTALGFIFAGNYGEFTAFCKSRGIMPEAMIEEINYFAFLTIEDIVLEEDQNEYRVIEDYTEEVKAWLKK